MVRLLILDLDILISAWLITFLLVNIVHLINIVRKYPNYNWSLLEEGRYFLPLLIFAVLYLISCLIPLESVRYSRFLVWFLIFLSFIIYKYNSIFKKGIGDQEKNDN